MFIEPPWDAPFLPAQQLGHIAESATISGMFPAAALAAARRLQVALPSARERYVAFKFYPLREHVQLVIELAERGYPELPMRQAVRKIGSYAPDALLTSTLGRVVFGTAEGVHSLITGMARGFEVNMPGCRVQLQEQSQNEAIVLLERVHLIDSHQVGAFEGVLRHAKVQGKVTVAMRDPQFGRFRLRW